MSAAAELHRARIARLMSISPTHEPPHRDAPRDRDWLPVTCDAKEPDILASGVIPKVREIADAVATVSSLSVLDIASSRRNVRLARARFAVVFLAKELTARSYPEIGRVLGGRDHTTIMHAYRRACDLMRTDGSFAALVHGSRTYLDRAA